MTQAGVAVDGFPKLFPKLLLNIIHSVPLEGFRSSP